MNKKTGLQVVMVLVIILISFWFYLKYFTNNFENIKEVQVTEKINEKQNSDSTYIHDISYTSIDVRGNEYQITAKLAELLLVVFKVNLFSGIIFELLLKYL